MPKPAAKSEGYATLCARESQRLFLDGQLLPESEGWQLGREPTPLVQVEEDLESLLATARRAQSALQDGVGALPGGTPWPLGVLAATPRAVPTAAFAYNPGTKCRTAAKMKAFVRFQPADGSRRHRHLLDLARLALVFPNCDMLLKGFEHVSRRFQVVAVRNHFSTPTRLGERFVEVLVVINVDGPEGATTPHICELRLEEMAFHKARLSAAPYLARFMDHLCGLYRRPRLRLDRSKEMVVGPDIDDLGFSCIVNPSGSVQLGVVAPGTWAAEVGFEDGDEIVALNGISPKSMRAEDFENTIRQRPLQITLGPRPAQDAAHVDSIAYLARASLTASPDSHGVRLLRRHLARHYGSAVAGWRCALGGGGVVSFRQFQDTCHELKCHERAPEYWATLDPGRGGCISLFELDPDAVVLLAKLRSRILMLAESDDQDPEWLFAKLTFQVVPSRSGHLESHEFRTVLKAMGLGAVDADRLFAYLDQGGSHFNPPASVTAADIAWLTQLHVAVDLEAATLSSSSRLTELECLRHLSHAGALVRREASGGASMLPPPELNASFSVGRSSPSASAFAYVDAKESEQLAAPRPAYQQELGEVHGSAEDLRYNSADMHMADVVPHDSGGPGHLTDAVPSVNKANDACELHLLEKPVKQAAAMATEVEAGDGIVDETFTAEDDDYQDSAEEDLPEAEALGIGIDESF